jgi:hypothetical protein
MSGHTVWLQEKRSSDEASESDAWLGNSAGDRFGNSIVQRKKFSLKVCLHERTKSVSRDSKIVSHGSKICAKRPNLCRTTHM